VEEQLSKRAMLDLICSEWEALEAVLGQLSQEEMIRPGVHGNWSVKDIIVHITAWEKRMVQWLDESLRGEIPQRPAPGMTWDDLDELNERIYQEGREKPLDEALAEFREIHQESVRAVEAMAEEDLLAPGRFEWREGDPIWRMVAANTWWHYKDHQEAIAGWMAGSA
jgi:hypothetical protein